MKEIEEKLDFFFGDESEAQTVLEEELFNLRFQAKMGQLSNPVRLRIVRRDIARVKTLLGDKARAAASSPAPAPSTTDKTK